MTLFLETIFSFPVVIYTTLLLISVLFWLFGAIDIFQSDSLDASSVDSDAGLASGLNGILLKFKLNEIPFTIVLTFIFLFAWLSSYILYRIFQTPMKGIALIYYGIGVANLLSSIIIGTCLTSLVLRPFNQWLSKLNPEVTHKSILGEIIMVRSSIVNQKKGEGFYEDGGAGMILQIRCFNEDNQMTRDDEAIIIRYEASGNYYEVIPLKKYFTHHPIQ